MRLFPSFLPWLLITLAPDNFLSQRFGLGLFCLERFALMQIICALSFAIMQTARTPLFSQRTAFGVQEMRCPRNYHLRLSIFEVDSTRSNCRTLHDPLKGQVLRLLTRERLRGRLLNRSFENSASYRCFYKKVRTLPGILFLSFQRCSTRFVLKIVFLITI